MQNYTIYCTPEQTKRALELGAPIEILSNYTEFRGFPFIKCQDGNERPYVPPTTEQMRGWLRTKGFKFKMVELKEVHWQCSIPPEFYQSGSTPSLEEATHAAIDTALEHLVKIKEENNI